MNLVNQYLALEHRSFFKELILDEIVEVLSKSIDKRSVSGKEVYLYHKDSLCFAIAFLLLLST